MVVDKAGHQDHVFQALVDYHVAALAPGCHGGEVSHSDDPVVNNTHGRSCRQGLVHSQNLAGYKDAQNAGAGDRIGSQTLCEVGCRILRILYVHWWGHTRSRAVPAQAHGGRRHRFQNGWRG